MLSKNITCLINSWLRVYVAFLLFIFSLSSCSKKTDLGSTILVDKDKINTYVSDTNTIWCSTVKQDPVKLYGSQNAYSYTLFAFKPYHMAGYYYDPLMGYSSSKLNFQITPNVYDPNEDFTGVTIDSVVLNLEYKGYYGNQGQANFQIREIFEVLSKTDPAYSNKKVFVSNTVIGSASYSVINKDSAYIEGIKQPATIRIPLYNYYGYDVLQQIKQSDFLSFVKGLQISVDTTKNQYANQGAVHFFDLLGNSSNVKIFYKSLTHEAKSIAFTISDSTVFFNTFYHSYDNTPAMDALQSSSDAPNMYIQSMQGLNGKLTFPYLSSLAQENTAFTKAELVIPVDYHISDLFPHSQLLLVEKETGIYNPIEDVFEGSSHFEGTLDIVNGTYTFNVTRYMQNEISALKKDPARVSSIYIVPDKLGVNDANRTVLFGKEKIKLKLYYLNL